MGFNLPVPPHVKMLPPVPEGRATILRKRILKFLLPKVKWTTANVSEIPEIVHDVLHSPLFQIAFGAVLFVLAFVKAVSVAVAIAIGVAWFVSVFGIARSKRIRNLQPTGRLVTLLVCTAALLLIAVTFERWAIRQSTKNSQSSSQQAHPEDKPQTPPSAACKDIKTLSVSAPRDPVRSAMMSFPERVASVTVDMKICCSVFAKDYNMIVLALIKDDSTDSLTDTRIEKSGVFIITEETRTIQVNLGDEFIIRGEAACRRFGQGSLSMYIGVVPKSVTRDQIECVNDVYRLCGALMNFTPRSKLGARTQSKKGVLPKSTPSEAGQDDYAPAVLSQMSVIELKNRTEIFCSGVEVLAKEWEKGYRDHNMAALKCQSGAKSDADKRLCAASRQADNEKLYHTLEDDFRNTYLRDAMTLKFELWNRASRIVVDSGGGVGPGISQPQLPSAPTLLDSGKAYGSNPWQDVCDYLNTLASRMYF